MDSTVAWARGAARGEVAVETLEGFRHEPFHEIGRDAVLERVAAWLEAHLPAGDGAPGAPAVPGANPRRREG